MKWIFASSVENFFAFWPIPNYLLNVSNFLLRKGQAELKSQLYIWDQTWKLRQFFYEEDKTSYFQQDVPGTPFQFAHIFSKHFVLEIGMNLEFKLQVYCQSLLEL